MDQLDDADHIPQEKVLTHDFRTVLYFIVVMPTSRFDTAFYLATLENQPPVLVEPNEVQEYLVRMNLT